MTKCSHKTEGEFQLIWHISPPGGTVLQGEIINILVN